MFSARLRLPESMPLAEKEQVVEEVIEELGLSKVKDSKIGNISIRGISGGEKKRTSVTLLAIAAYLLRLGWSW